MFVFFCGRFVWRIRGSFVLLEPWVTGRFLSNRYCLWIPVKFTRTTRANIRKDVMLWSEQNPSYVIVNECRYAIFRVIAPSFIVRKMSDDSTHIGRSTQFPSLCQRKNQTIDSQNRQSANNLWTTYLKLNWLTGLRYTCERKASADVVVTENSEILYNSLSIDIFFSVYKLHTLKVNETQLK